MNKQVITIVKEISSNIGPRRPTSKEEKKTALYLENAMKKCTQDVFMMPFPSLSSFSYSTMVSYLFSVLGGILGLFHIPLGLVLSILGLLSFVLEVNSIPVITRWLSRRESQNVIGYIPPEKKKKKKVIVVAHYDSSRSSILFHPALVGGFRRSFLLMAGATLMIPLLLLLSFFFQGTLFSYLPLLPSLYLFGSLLVLIHREIFGQDTPGANDNAAGVATLLKVGEEIGIDRPKYTEIYLVATGSEESGTVGMIHLLESWKERLAGCYVINLDNLGTGQLKYTTGEGMLKVYPSSKELVSYLKEIIRQEGYHLVPTVNSFMTTDAVPAMVRGYPSISLRAEDKDGLLPNWHWPTDTWEKVEEENLHLAVKVVMSLIKKIDDESKLV